MMKDTVLVSWVKIGVKNQQKNVPYLNNKWTLISRNDKMKYVILFVSGRSYLVKQILKRKPTEL